MAVKIPSGRNIADLSSPDGQPAGRSASGPPARTEREIGDRAAAGQQHQPGTPATGCLSGAILVGYDEPTSIEHMFDHLFWEVGVGIPYLGPLQPLRTRHGRDALIDYRRDHPTRFDGTLPTEHLAHLLAGHLIETDDAHCRQLGLVVAGDRILRADLEALTGTAPPRAGCGHPAPVLHCRDCHRTLAWPRVRAALGHRHHGGP